MMLALIFPASASEPVVNISSCITGLDTGATCDLATFPSSPANIIRDVKYCCNNPLSFQEWGVCGVCGGGGDQYNVPVCHSVTSALNGQSRGNLLLSQFLVTSSCRRSRQVQENRSSVPRQLFPGGV